MPLVRRPAAARSGTAIPEGQAAPSTLLRDALYRRGLALADLASAVMALVLGVAVLGDDGLTLAAVLALPLVVLINKTAGLYDRDEHRLGKTTLEELPALFQTATLYALLIWLGEGLLVEGDLSQGQVVAVWGFLFLSFAVSRVIAR